MGKTIIILFLLLEAGFAHAQNLDISLFSEEAMNDDYYVPDDEELPQLGRKAAPLDSVLLAPPPAPQVRISLTPDIPPAPPPAPQATPEADASDQAISLSSAQTPSSLPVLPTTNVTDSGTTPSPFGNKPAPEKIKPPLHNVLGFDLSGFELNETLTSVLKKAKKQGFKVKTTEDKIPLFYATDYAHKCRNEGLVIPQKVNECILNYAESEKTAYIAKAVLTRKNEVLELYFTSRAVDNLLYKIVYLNKGDNSLNFTRINKERKRIRQQAFWNAVFDKYGYPDDGENYIWGDPTKAYMKIYMDGSAYNAYIIMEDVKLSNEDYWAAEDAQSERPSPHTFSF